MRTDADIVGFDEAILDQVQAIRTVGRARLGGARELDDFTQEVVLRAYANRDQLRDTASVRPWIHAIARNTAMNWNSRRIPLPVERLPDVVSDAPSPHELAADGERWRMLTRALRSLTPRDRAILLARYGEGKAYGELSQEHGLSRSALRFRVHRATKRLRQWARTCSAALAICFASRTRNAMGTTMAIVSGKKAWLLAAGLVATATVAAVGFTGGRSAVEAESVVVAPAPPAARSPLAKPRAPHPRDASARATARTEAPRERAPRTLAPEQTTVAPAVSATPDEPAVAVHAGPSSTSGATELEAIVVESLHDMDFGALLGMARGEAARALSGAAGDAPQRDGGDAEAMPILASLYAAGGTSPNANEYRFHVVSSLPDADHVRMDFVLKSDGESWWIDELTSR